MAIDDQGRPVQRSDYQRVNPKRVYGNYEVLHSSASGWYVFDHDRERVVAYGLDFEDAKRRAQQEAAKRHSRVSPLTAVLTWNDGAVAKAAKRILGPPMLYQDLPLLADMLEEAGYTNPAVLASLRSRRTDSMVIGFLNQLVYPSRRQS